MEITSQKEQKRDDSAKNQRGHDWPARPRVFHPFTQAKFPLLSQHLFCTFSNPFISMIDRFPS